jgi:hypothetical protein
MGIPTVPLTDCTLRPPIIFARAAETIQLRASVESFRCRSLLRSRDANGQEQKFDYLVLAVPFDGLARILPETIGRASGRGMLGQFQTSPITGIHLWFDREISDLDHAVLLDRTIQWMFHKSRLIRRLARMATAATLSWW